MSSFKCFLERITFYYFLILAGLVSVSTVNAQSISSAPKPETKPLSSHAAESVNIEPGILHTMPLEPSGDADFWKNSANSDPIGVQKINRTCATNSTNGSAPASITGAVGLINMVVVTNNTINVYDKRSCSRISTQSLKAFFATSGVAANEILIQPRIIWDFVAERFFVTAMSITPGSQTQFQYFGLSDDETGTTWRNNRLDLGNTTGSFCKSSRGAAWFNPTLGYSRHRFFITANDYPEGGGPPTSNILIFNKSALSPVCIKGLPFNLVPPIVRDDSRDAYFLSPGSGSGNSVKRYRLTIPRSGSNTLINLTDFTIPAWSVADAAAQPNGQKLNVGDGRFYAPTIQIGDNLWNIHTIKNGARSQIRWYKFAKFSNTPVAGTTFSSPAINYFNASLTTNSSFPSTLFVNSNTTIPSNATFGNVSVFAFRGPNSSTNQGDFTAELVQTSNTQFTSCPAVSGCQWGTNSSVQVDPVAPSTAWAFNALVDGTIETGWRTIGTNFGPTNGAPAIKVLDANGFTSIKPAGGIFAPTSKTYTVQNIGNAPLTYTTVENVSGTRLEGSVNGTLQPGSSTTVRLIVTADADTVAPGTTRSGSVAFTNTVNGFGNTSRPIALTNNNIPGILTVTPAEGYTSTGFAGETISFAPAFKLYQLKNTGGTVLNFTASENIVGMKTNISNGTLDPGGTVVLLASIDASVRTVTGGQTKNGTLTIKDVTSNKTITRPLKLVVNLRPTNDNIAASKNVTGVSGSSISSPNFRYTLEGGERKHSNDGSTANGRSAWWKWKAPSTGQITFSSASSVGNTVIAAYVSPTTTPNVRTLTQIASNDDFAGGSDGLIHVNAVQGKTYYVAIAAKNIAETATGTYTLRWTKPSGTTAGLVAAVLPGARSVRTTSTATAFGSIINSSTITAQRCYITMPSENVGSSLFQYQTTNAANSLVGRVNTPVNIPAGKSQGFVFGVTPSVNITNGKDVKIVFDCANMAPVTTVVGLNTILISSATTQPADMVAIADTVTKNGIADIVGNTGTGFFVASVVNNNGPSRTITASVDTGSTTLPVRFTLCQTNPSTGACLAPATASVRFTAQTNSPKTFSIFLKGTGRVAFDPAKNRAFLRFKEGVITRGATSVAIRTK